MNKLIFFSVLMFIVTNLKAADKYKLEDFSLNLNSCLTPPNHLWVSSGWSTVNPISTTVMGAGDCIGAPFAGRDFKLFVTLEANGHLIKDVGSTGKGDVGLLFQGGQWQPDKIIRKGTYNYLIDNNIISFGVQSELIPLYNRTGFIVKCSIRNRSWNILKIKVSPEITPGNPNYIPLNSWTYGQPGAGEAATSKGDGIWSNNKVKIALFTEELTFDIPANMSHTSYIAVTFTEKESISVPPQKLRDWEQEERVAWENRLNRALRDVPVVRSSIPGLDDYYKRSIVSGLVSIWENPAFVVNPFLATSGIDGGATCTYLWDFGGYIPRMACLILGDKVLPCTKAMANIGLDKSYAYTLDGTGIGVPYAYSTWSFVNLVWEISKHMGIKDDLFNEARRLVLLNEKLESPNNLIDYGVQHNLLEMRSAGWEHFVASPNAERAWCLERLADMGEKISYNPIEIKQWREKSLIIKNAVQDQLWDPVSHWFKCIYPNGHTEQVYSIQVYDALRAGVCTNEMTNDLLEHLKDGLFLFPNGVSSVSAEDSVHYEVNDTDWSGGGAYTGDGPDLALILYGQGKSEIAWDILKRHFWMGKYLTYYPQEHYVDRPAVPAHKRANECSGLIGAESILYGMIGLDPRIDGSLWINPQVPASENISIKGYGCRTNSFDLEFSKDNMRIIKNSVMIYEGKVKSIKLL
jgi:hypothetical protein